MADPVALEDENRSARTGDRAGGRETDHTSADDDDVGVQAAPAQCSAGGRSTAPSLAEATRAA